MATDENQAAHALTEYLTTPSSYGSRTSPLTDIVRARITRLANGIADEVVGGNAELRGVLRKRVEQVIRDALRDDAAYLSEVVGQAVGKALARLAVERSPGDIDDD
jgi:hypothetical protein